MNILKRGGKQAICLCQCPYVTDVYIYLQNVPLRKCGYALAMLFCSYFQLFAIYIYEFWVLEKRYYMSISQLSLKCANKNSCSISPSAFLFLQ